MYWSGSNSDISSPAFGFELYQFISNVKKKKFKWISTETNVLEH